MSDEAEQSLRVRIFSDDAGEFRFSAVAANGEVVATSSEGYVRHVDAVAEAQKLWPDAELQDETQGV